MRDQLQKHLEKRVQQCVSSVRNSELICPKIEIKRECISDRKGEIVKAKASGKIRKTDNMAEIKKVFYDVHFQYLINLKGSLYVEEEVEHRVAEFYKEVLVQDVELNPYDEESNEKSETVVYPVITSDEEGEDRLSFEYNRLKAVQYAERWWNSFNPAYKKFEVDCTNYISQCLNAGGAPMLGYPNRSKGWWIRSSNWSYSWTVANSLRWYLPGAKAGIRAKEVSSPEQLQLGDVICYDFQGDGRFDHTTIVTNKDGNGMPLVNAHTTNSRMRYWAYQDSTAYTPNIKYKFLSVVDNG